MEVYSKLVKIDDPLVVTIGTYDAIHIGHLEIINRMKSKNLKKGIISFYPPPFVYFGFEKRVLFTLNEKIDILKELSIDFLFSLEFNEKIKNLNANEFIETLLKYLNINVIIVGKSFRFGNDRKGTKDTLIELGKKYNFLLETVEEKKFDNEKISSSKLRKYIKEGEIEKVNKFLVKNYFIYLKRENNQFLIDPLKLLPKDGIYEVKIDKKIEKLLNISNGKFYFNEEINLKEFKVEFLKRVK